MRWFTAHRSVSFISIQRVISSKVRKQLRHTSSPRTVVQWPMHGLSAVTTGGDTRCTDQVLL